MPDNTINWGQGAVENTNDWGKGKINSSNNWGKVYETSPAGDTNIEGGLALSITYSASAYCDGIGDTPQPTVANNTGAGTFSSTTGLTINSTTGVIDVDASTKGATYLVTYTDTDLDTATANVTLNALDNAAFAYSASSYEPTDADPTPTITGLTGGTFSAGSGLVFVDSGTNTGSSTGEIDLSASTVASYTITYDTTSSGSSVCPNTSTQTVEIAVAGIANNYSMDFDGSNDYINVGNDSSLAISGDFTISLWVNQTTTTAFSYLLDKGGAGSSINYRGGINSSNQVYFQISGNSLTSTGTITNGTWSHIVLVKSGTSMNIYIDNTAETPATAPATAYTGTENLEIGRQTGGANYLNGKLDEVAIWNTALTATQVAEIYNATSTNLTKDLTTVSGSNLVYWNRMGD